MPDTLKVRWFLAPSGISKMEFSEIGRRFNELQRHNDPVKFSPTDAR